MVGKNDQNFIAFCDELKAYVLENRYFPNRHTRLLNKIKFVCRKINQGILEKWKLKMFLGIAGCGIWTVISEGEKRRNRRTSK